MLEDYKDKQPIAYQILKNAINNQKVSHAYLLDSGNCNYGIDMMISFVKTLICPYHINDNKGCAKCSICRKIDGLNYSELKIIKPDGIWIKKEQLDELQNEFSKKAIEGKYKIYIIEQVEKLNTSAANSLLKFLEEPEDGIIAILITNNIFQVLETIRSRCQILTLKHELHSDKETVHTLERLSEYIKQDIFVQNEEYQNFVNIIIHFIDSLEKEGKDAFLFTNKLWHHHVHEKDEFLLAFDIMILFYHDVLNYICNRPLNIFVDQQEQIFDIAQKNSLQEIIQKIKILMEQKNKIKININNNLLIDQLVLRLAGVDVYD